MTLLTVENLGVAFGNDVPVVRDVSFTIKKGEAVALVGESGSGKSITALSLLQLLPSNAWHPTGRITFDGQVILSSANEAPSIPAPEEVLRSLRGNRIGMIFQEPMTSLNPLHTLSKQIGEVLFLHKKLSPDQAKERILDLLHLVALPNPEKRLNAYPHELSGGQRQRVMIAMALANDPDLLIADEPTTALDVTIQAQILSLLKDLQKRLGMALLMITHDLGIVRKVADKVCVMRQGELVEQALTDQIFAAPRHPYTKMLIGSEPKGSASPIQKNAPEVLNIANMKVYFPIKKGVFGKAADYVRAVDGVSLIVREGETVGIVGESGSGKTTLGLALLRLMKSEGRIAFLGKDITTLPKADLRKLRTSMQVVFQEPYGSLSPRMSAGDIIAEGLDINNLCATRQDREERIIAAMKEVGLDPETRNRYPHEFSGGQRQRIAVARAIILQPKFVVLDEPTSALDRSIQSQMIDLLRSVQQAHKIAFLFISHDLRVIRALSHRVVVMQNGKIVEQGTAEEIFAAPKECYTQALLAAAFAA